MRIALLFHTKPPLHCAAHGPCGADRLDSQISQICQTFLILKGNRSEYEICNQVISKDQWCDILTNAVEKHTYKKDPVNFWQTGKHAPKGKAPQ
jgi:hypothetical protein